MATAKAKAKKVEKATVSTKPKASAPSAPAPTPAPTPAKKHERRVKPSEAELLEKGRRIAAHYLEHRDGMDPQVALDVVESMSPEDIRGLIEEANTAVMDTMVAAAQGNTAPPTETPTPTPAAPTTTRPGAAFVTDPDPDPAKAVTSFLEVPDLAASETFAQDVLDCVSAARRKNDAEKEYKSIKARLLPLLKPLSGKGYIEMAEIKMEAYVGHSVFLNEQLLLEQGVDPDIIKKCWKDTPYDDVRLIVPKPVKG